MLCRCSLVLFPLSFRLPFSKTDRITLSLAVEAPEEEWRNKVPRIDTIFSSSPGLLHIMKQAPLCQAESPAWEVCVPVNNGLVLRFPFFLAMRHGLCSHFISIVHQSFPVTLSAMGEGTMGEFGGHLPRQYRESYKHSHLAPINPNPPSWPQMAHARLPNDRTFPRIFFCRVCRVALCSLEDENMKEKPKPLGPAPLFPFISPPYSVDFFIKMLKLWSMSSHICTMDWPVWGPVWSSTCGGSDF